MSKINTALFKRTVSPFYHKLFDDASASKLEVWKKIYKTEKSGKGAFEEETEVHDFGLAKVKREGEGVFYDTAGEGLTTRFVPVTYSLGFRVTEEVIEDGQAMDIGKKFAPRLADSLRATRRLVHAQPFNWAFSSAKTYADGKPLLATDHPLAGGGTYSNKLATPMDLSEAALEQARTQIKHFTDARGKPIEVNIEQLIIPHKLFFTAERLLKANLRPGTDLNDPNVLKMSGTVPKGVLEVRELTDEDAWFLQTDVDRGAIHKTKREVRRDMEGDFETGDVRYKADERYAIGIVDSRAFFGSEGA